MSLVDAAQAGGAQHFVATAFTMKLDFPLHNARRAAKQHLKGSKLAC